MKYESTICSFPMFPSAWRLSGVAILLGASLVVSTLQAQINITPTPTPTPTPEPTATPAAASVEEGLAQVRDEVILTREEIVIFRRLVIIMAGIALGWSTCLLIFKYH
jgi:hypothetical protein